MEEKKKRCARACQIYTAMRQEGPTTRNVLAQSPYRNAVSSVSIHVLVVLVATFAPLHLRLAWPTKFGSRLRKVRRPSAKQKRLPKKSEHKLQI